MPAKILVVDDDHDLTEVIADSLADQGFEVETANSAQHALAKLDTGWLPNTIILDMVMPDMDGNAFLKALYANPSTAHIPVIVLSGAPLAAMKTAAYAHLPKPISSEILVTAITIALQTGAPVRPLPRVTH